MKLLYAERWKDSELPRMEEWLVKMELDEKVSLTSLIRENILSTFIADWKTLMGFWYKTDKSEFIIYGFIIQIIE